MLDTRQIHSLSDFVRNSKAHVARLKETGTPEVLTVNGRAEVVMLDTATYENLMERLQNAESVALLRAHMAHARRSAPPREPITEEEKARRHKVMDELVAETERLGLYE
jgi:PHD/YefM family antitoxin component YafN of YafNO toxin-antitoxin module